MRGKGYHSRGRVIEKYVSKIKIFKKVDVLVFSRCLNVRCLNGMVNFDNNVIELEM